MGGGLQGSERGWLRLLGTTGCCGWLKGKGRTVAAVGRYQQEQQASETGLRGRKGEKHLVSLMVEIWSWVRIQ